MFGRERVSRWLVSVCVTVLGATGILTVSPTPPARAATPPAYYAIAIGMVDGVTNAGVINDSGVVAGQFGVTNQGNQGVARVSGTTVERFPLTGGGTAFAINAGGSMVGFEGNSTLRAIRVDGSTVTPIPGLEGSAGDVAYDIDDAGTTVVGSSFYPGPSRSWTNDGTETTQLPGLGGDYENATRINNAGVIAGTAADTDGKHHLVIWQGGAIQDIGGGAFSSASATDMNEAGHVLGSVTIPPNTNRAILWNGTTATDLGTLPGGDWTSGVAMNESGGIVVNAQNSAGKFRAARWDGTALVDLGALSGGNESFAGGINEQGQIVGSSYIDATRLHGFLIDDGVMYDLNDLLPPHSVEVENAHAISDSGHILASGRNGLSILLVPGTRPAADYDVIDVASAVDAGGGDITPADMNVQRQVTGDSSGRAWVYNGTTASYIFAGFTESYGVAINESGIVAGNQDLGTGTEAFTYDGTVHPLGTLGGPTSFAQDLNDAGDVVGVADASGGGRHAFLYRDGAMTDLHTLGGVSSIATEVNESGVVIGNYSPTNGTFRGFVSDGTTTTDLGTLGGSTAPFDINGSGVIVGSSGSQAFRYENGSMTTVAPPGSTSSSGIAINESGAIAGQYVDGSGNSRGFLLDGGVYSLIPGMGGTFATTMDINGSGDVVGYATTGTSIRGYLFKDGQLVDLTTKIPLGYEAFISVAIEIADDGTILARGQTPGFQDRALLLVPAGAPPPAPGITIDTSRPAASSVAKYGRFEKQFTLNRTYAADEVHDPAIIDVTATFRAPSGASYTVPAFFGTDYAVQPGTGVGNSENYVAVPGTESGVWHARFSPDETGTWQYTLRAQDKRPGQTATRVSAQLTFTVTGSSSKGQVERDPRDPRFLRYSDGTPYYPMGHNVAFQQGEPLDNDGEHYVGPLFASMEAAGQNWTRIWMTDFNRNAIEWSTGHWAGWYGGVGQYAGQSAFRIERQLDVADQHGLQVQLVINDHGQVRSLPDGRWAENPYNAANGGPVPAASPEDFFTDPTARQLFKQRLRYLVARYGSYRNVLTWELFNEVQFVGSPAGNPGNSQQVRDAIVAWHAEMAAYLRSIDPYGHLITTSSDIESSLADIWADPNIDLVQVHDYEPGLTDRDTRFRGYVENLNESYQKPVIMAEFGIVGNPEINFDPQVPDPLEDRRAHLFQATHLHNAMWSSAMSGSGAMSWWWGAYIHSAPSRNRVPPEFPANERHNPPLRDFFAGEDLAGMALDYSTISAPATVVALGLDNGSEGFAWIRDADNEYGSGVGPGDIEGRTMSGIAISLNGYTNGTYRIEVHDPWGVAPIDDSRLAVATGDSLTIALPDFTRDVAIKIRPIGPATTDQPVTAVVTSPVPGSITITEVSPPAPPPVGSGYTFIGTQLDITAPTASTANPLTLAFTVDQAALASVDPDLTAMTLAVFRNGVPVAECTPSGADDPATPDPCIAQRETLSGGADEGDARITVRSSAASSWTVGSAPTATAPGAPTAVTAVRGNAQAGVSWTAPTDDGGSPITGYTATASPGGQTATVGGTTTTAVVTGLTNGTSYTFTVRASNAAGTGPPSAPSNAVTPGPQLNQTISFPNPGPKNLTQSPVMVSPTASSGLPVTLTSTTTAVCTVEGFVITLLTAGSCSITATQPGDLTYRPANPVTRTFSVNQATQTITFPNPGAKTMAQSPVTVAPTASSGLPVTLTSTTPAVCTVDAFTITLLGPGSCSITATQPGNTVFRAANPITRAFNVTKVTQSITFVRPANATLLDSPVTVAPTASSGLPVTLASTTPATCSVSGFDITLLTTGTCTIRATQPGDAIYAAAPAVTRSFSIAKATQTITIPDPGPQSMLVPTVVLTPYASSGLPVTLASTTAAVCTVSGDVVTLRRAGTCRIRGTQAGDAVYRPAPAVTLAITVTAAAPMPFVVASGDALTVGGQPFRFHGAAIYGTSNPGAPNSPARAVALASQAGLNSLRIVNPFVEDGTSAGAPVAAADWQRVDQILARARGAGIRVVLDLSGFRNHLVNRDIQANNVGATCATEHPDGVDYAAIDPYRPALQAEWEQFLDFVVGRINSVNGVSYRDDATIAVISIAGEPLPPASDDCGKATSTAGLTDFYERTLGYLASIDPNHLRSTGGFIHLDWASGIDGQAIFALADNTLPALHTYPSQYETDGTPIDPQTPVYGPHADSLGKPWFTEEFGWKQEVGDPTRAGYYEWLYDEQATYGSDGALFWNLGLEEASGSHDVNPSTPQTWAVVQAQ